MGENKQEIIIYGGKVIGNYQLIIKLLLVNKISPGETTITQAKQSGKAVSGKAVCSDFSAHTYQDHALFCYCTYKIVLTKKKSLHTHTRTFITLSLLTYFIYFTKYFSSGGAYFHCYCTKKQKSLSLLTFAYFTYFTYFYLLLLTSSIFSAHTYQDFLALASVCTVNYYLHQAIIIYMGNNYLLGGHMLGLFGIGFSYFTYFRRLLYSSRHSRRRGQPTNSC